MPLLFGLIFGSTLLGGLTYTVLRLLMRRSLPQVDGVLKAAGLGAPVEIIRDRWGVPHIYAQSQDDLVFAQGFTHAQDRLWQMEMNRRAGHGRLAELFGTLAFGTDHFLRTVGFARAAQNDLRQLDAPSLHTLEQYARGVNAFIDQNGERLPLEFTLLRFKPEPWQPLDSLVYGKVLAWGFTNAFPDVQDLFVEKTNPDNPAQVEFRGTWEDVQVLREAIRVKGEAAPRIVEIEQTRHGPVINHLTALTKDAAPRIAFRWTAQDGGSILRAVEQINRASNWTEFCAAVRDWDVPSQNMVYADTAGNIGYYMPGRIPIRAKGMGLTPAPGWSGEYEWTGWIPHAELPQAFNPPQHFIATANNQVVGREYPHFLTSATMNGFRARRIVELLSAQEKLSADDFARIQVDLYCAPAKPFCELLAAVRPSDGYTREALVRLASWDFQLTADSVPGAIYELTQHFALRRVFGPWLGELTENFIGVGFHPLLAALSSYQDRSLVTLQSILSANESDWFKDAAGRPVTREQILAAALDDAIAYLRKTVGQDLSRWQWGRIHQAGFNHTLGARKPLDRIFNRGPYPYGGDTNTVWQAAFVPKLPFSAAGFSASWRQIIDVGDWDASRVVHTTGQSGQPASRHYDDMLPLWLHGEYHPMLWAREKVLAHAEATLRLEP